MNRRTWLVLCALPIVLAACGSGRNAQVLQEHTVANSTQADLSGGAIQVRNVFATPTDITQTQVPAGGAVALHLRVFNNSDQPELMALAPPATLSGTGTLGGAVPIPAHGDVWVGGPSGTVTGSIASLPHAVFVGTYVSLRVQFNTAGHVDLTVPLEDAVLSQSS